MGALQQGVLERLTREVLDAIYLLGKVDDAPAGGPSVSSWIHLTGEDKHWIVCVQCSENLLRSTAGLIFGKDPVNVSWYNMTQTLAEVVNMVGGNLKGIRGEFTGLSLPSTVNHPGMAPGFTETSLLQQEGMEYRNGRLEISIHEVGNAMAAV